MIIERVEKNIFNKKMIADRKRAKADETVTQCVEKGNGTYLIIDDEKFFTTQTNMILYLRRAARLKMRETKDTNIRVATQNNQKQIYIVVEQWGLK